MMEGEDDVGSQFDQQQAQSKRAGSLLLCVFGTRKKATRRKLLDVDHGQFPHPFYFVSNFYWINSSIVSKSISASHRNHNTILQSSVRSNIGWTNQRFTSFQDGACLPFSWSFSFYESILSRDTLLLPTAWESSYWTILFSFCRPWMIRTTAQPFQQPEKRPKNTGRLPGVFQNSNFGWRVRGVHSHLYWWPSSRSLIFPSFGRSCWSTFSSCFSWQWSDKLFICTNTNMYQSVGVNQSTRMPDKKPECLVEVCPNQDKSAYTTYYYWRTFGRDLSERNFRMKRTNVHNMSIVYEG